MCQHVIDLNDFICPNLFYSECGGAGNIVALSGTAAENKKPEDANSAAGIILVGRAGVGVPFFLILSIGFNKSTSRNKGFLGFNLKC